LKFPYIYYCGKNGQSGVNSDAIQLPDLENSHLFARFLLFFSYISTVVANFMLTFQIFGLGEIFYTIKLPYFKKPLFDASLLVVSLI